MSSEKVTYKSITAMGQNIDRTVERMDRHNKEKLQYSTDFIRFIAQPIKDILGQRAALDEQINYAIRSIDLADEDGRFVDATNKLTNYIDLLGEDLDFGHFMELRMEMINIYREELSKDVRTFGGDMHEAAQNLLKFIAAVVRFLEAEKKELEKKMGRLRK